MNVHTKFEVCWDNREYSKNLGSPCIRPRSLFSQISHGLLFRRTLWMYGFLYSAQRKWRNEKTAQRRKQSNPDPNPNPDPIPIPHPKRLFSLLCCLCCAICVEPNTDSLNVSTKFAVRSFTHSWDSDCIFGLGEGEAIGVGDGTVQMSIGEFLQVLHSNFSPVFSISKLCWTECKSTTSFFGLTMDPKCVSGKGFTPNPQLRAAYSTPQTPRWWSEEGLGPQAYLPSSALNFKFQQFVPQAAALFALH